MRSPSHGGFRASARAHQGVLRVSQAATHRSSVRSRTKQRARTCCHETSDEPYCPYHGPYITRRRRFRLLSSPKPSVLLTLSVMSTAHGFSHSGPGPKPKERNHR
jgi:hypothetical protein